MDAVERRDPAFIIDNGTFEEALEEVLGEDWMLRFNAATGISPRQIKRWISGTEPLPRYVVCLVRLIRGEKHIGIDGA